MKIALVGPGIMEIPPKGWGAVESLIWDYATELGELGHEGTIINTPDRAQIIRDLTKENMITYMFTMMCSMILWIIFIRHVQMPNWQSVLTILTSTNQTDILTTDTIRYTNG